MMVSGLAKLWSFYLVWGLASNFPFVRYNSLRDGLSKSEMKKIINFRGKKIGAFLSMVPCLGICLIVTISTKALTFHVFGYSSAGNGRKHFFQISFENSENFQNFGYKTIFVAPVASELRRLKYRAYITPYYWISYLQLGRESTGFGVI